MTFLGCIRGSPTGCRQGCKVTDEFNALRLALGLMDVLMPRTLLQPRKWKFVM